MGKEANLARSVGQRSWRAHQSRAEAGGGAAPAQHHLFAALAANAAAEDSGDQDISRSLELLRQMGWLVAALPRSMGGSDLGGGGSGAERSVRAFMTLAQANLSVARLFEGHVNALQLIGKHAPHDLQRLAARKVREGALLGVWGADASDPVRSSDNGESLTGVKRFASGLGVVSCAVVTVDSGPTVRLALVETCDPSRQNPAAWTMSGMRASASGEYDLSGLTRDAFTLFGSPGCYHDEPGFVGGVWRIAALQLGGTFGLIEAARDRLGELGRLEAEPQIARLSHVLQRALGAIGLVESAARLADGPAGRDAPERAVALSIFARLLTEEVGQASIAAVERAVGLQHFDDASETGRIARDLAVYMRQVAPDAFQQRAGRAALLSPQPLMDLLND